ncbi:MAG: hypothetical protein U0525_03360 [Patescibacteria group bacterium]
MGHPVTHIQFIKSNKIHLPTMSSTRYQDKLLYLMMMPRAMTPLFATGSINITGGFIDAGSGKNFWVDNRTNSSSKGIIVSGVRMGTGVKTQLFNESKDYQQNTYTTANIVDGFVNPDFNDDVVLINAASGAIDVSYLQL